MSDSQPNSIEQCIVDITECPICNEVLHDNRCLPCLHTFCLECLESYRKGKPKGKTLSCPVCRREFPIPKCIASLPRNFFIDKLTDAHKVRKQQVLPKRCDICSEDTKGVPATRFCCDCHQNLCLSCEKQHKKIKATAFHKVIDNASVSDPQELASRPTYCYIHTTKEADVYCQDCKKVMCWQCVSVFHGPHVSIDICNAAKDLASKLEMHVEQISQHLRIKQDDIQKLTERENLYKDEIDAEAANICRELNKLYKRLTDNGEKLKKALTTSTTVHLEAIRVLRDKLETDKNELKKHKVYIEQMIHLGNVSDLCEYTDELISKTAEMTAEKTCKIKIPPVTRLSESDLQDLLIGRRTDIDQQYCNRYMDKANKINNNKDKLQDDLQSNDQSKDSCKERPKEMSSANIKRSERSETLQRTEKKHDKSPSKKIKVTTSKDESEDEPCNQSSYDEVTDVLQQVVKTDTTSESVLQNPCNLPDTTQTTAEKTLSDESSSKYKDWSLKRTIFPEDGAVVCGITVLASKMYIVFQNSNSIHVYDSVAFVFLKNLTVDGLANPNDLASCKFNNCLYICDWGTRSIFRVEISDEMKHMKWGINRDLGGLSVTAEHSVLLAGYMSNKLKEYTSNGELIRSIDLEDGLKPWHAVRLVSGDFLICHGDHPTGRHRVCIVGLDGKLKTAFGGVRGSDEKQLCGPYHLAVDKSGCILVNDCNHRRILLLTPSLRFIKQLIPSAAKVLRRARRMFLDEEIGRLYVADNATHGGKPKDGRILVFNISKV